MAAWAIEGSRFTSPTSSAQLRAMISPTPGMVCNRATRSLRPGCSHSPFSSRRWIVAKNSNCPRLSLSSSTTAQVKQYQVNGTWKPLHDGEYIPDLMHIFIVSFLAKHKDQPFT